jgi:glycosyltransferase involved in cell wall biosynthesis
MILRWRRIAAAFSAFMQLRKIRMSHRGARQTIIFPPGLDWSEHLFQRPQQLAKAMAAQGALVFYLRPHPDFYQDKFIEVHPNLYVCNTSVDTFALWKSPLIYLLTWNRGYQTVFRKPRILYDFVDDLRVFDGDAQELRQDHERLVQESHLVLTTATNLHRAVLQLRPDALLCPNGVDYAHFAAARQKGAVTPPVDMETILGRGNPIVGYYGALAEWFDYDLVMEVARRRPDVSFVIIGPDYDGTMPPSFLALPNLDWLGIKPYAELPSYLAYFDVAMIPFELNKITHATSPLKLFEYMAGGKPVIVTPMQESMRYDGVLVAEGPEAFSQRIDDALRLRNTPAYLQRIDRTARANTWAVRAEQILSALDEIG